MRLGPADLDSIVPREQPARRFVARTVIKILASVIGGYGSLVAAAALIGLLTDNIWIRYGIAVVVLVAVPAIIADRLLPEDPKAAPGLTSDVFSLFWIVGALLLNVALGGLTRPALVGESTRLRAAGLSWIAVSADWLSGVPAPRASRGSP